MKLQITGVKIQSIWEHLDQMFSLSTKMKGEVVKLLRNSKDCTLFMKNMWATKKNVLLSMNTGCSIGILIMVYYHPHIPG